MYSFLNDYSESAHERLLDALIRTNREQTAAYGEDKYCEEARGYLRTLIGDPYAAVHFLMGGTQTNLTLIAAALRPHQGVVAAATGHIALHESGAIEACGHKVLTVPMYAGKLSAADVEAVFEAHYNDINLEHTVQPAMVYISHPTEYGTLYTLDELMVLRRICDRFDAYLYLDGARLGCALTAAADVTAADIHRLTDAFYFGGTKQGALYGEALVIRDASLKRDFRYIQKQKGAMLAKGQGLGIQFAELFRDGLYLELARHANAMAARLSEGLTALGIPLYVPTETNQVFAILPDAFMSKLKDRWKWTVWERYDETQSVLRFCTSWATPAEMIEAFLADIKANQ